MCFAGHDSFVRKNRTAIHLLRHASIAAATARRRASIGSGSVVKVVMSEVISGALQQLLRYLARSRRSVASALLAATRAACTGTRSPRSPSRSISKRMLATGGSSTGLAGRAIGGRFGRVDEPAVAIAPFAA